MVSDEHFNTLNKNVEGMLQVINVLLEGHQKTARALETYSKTFEAMVPLSDNVTALIKAVDLIQTQLDMTDEAHGKDREEVEELIKSQAVILQALERHEESINTIANTVADYFEQQTKRLGKH